MKSYVININSNWRAILLAVIFFGISLNLTLLIPKDLPDFIAYILLGIAFFAPILPVTHLSRGKLKIEISDEYFRAIWIKRFFLSNEPDVELAWNRIIEYVYQVDRGFDSFRLTLTRNQQFKFYRYTYLPQNDDFEKFLNQFPKFIRKADIADNNTIKQGKTDFQTRSFKWLWVVVSALVIGMVIDALINPDSETRWASLGVILSAILFYWIQVAKK